MSQSWVESPLYSEIKAAFVETFHPTAGATKGEGRSPRTHSKAHSWRMRPVIRRSRNSYSSSSVKRSSRSRRALQRRMRSASCPKAWRMSFSLLKVALLPVALFVSVLGIFAEQLGGAGVHAPDLAVLDPDFPPIVGAQARAPLVEGAHQVGPALAVQDVCHARPPFTSGA